MDLKSLPTERLRSLLVEITAEINTRAVLNKVMESSPLSYSDDDRNARLKAFACRESTIIKK